MRHITTFFSELLEDEPEIVIAVGAFFLEQSQDPQFQSGVQLLRNPLNSDSVTEAQLENSMQQKMSKKQAKMNLVQGLKSMGIVLNHADVEDLFGRFANKVTGMDETMREMNASEDPNEVLLEVTKHIVEER